MLKSLTDIWHYFLGNYRYKLYCYRHSTTFTQIRPEITAKDRFKRFLGYILFRDHIIEQIKYRVDWMDADCYMSGQCKLCGCETIALQCANKPCDKPCYPAMMTRSQWNSYKKGGAFNDKNGTWLAVLSQNLKPIYFKQTKYGFEPQNSIIPEEDSGVLSRKEEQIRSDHNTGHY